MKKEIYKLLKNKEGEVLFFRRKIYNKNDEKKWEDSLKTLIRKKDIKDATEELFINRAELKLSHLHIIENSEIKIYENEYVKFIKILDSEKIKYKIFEKILQEVTDRNGTKYILAQKEG